MKRDLEYVDALIQWLRPRVSRGSAAAFATALGRHQSAISRMLRDGRQIKASELQLIADHFGEEPPRALPLHPKHDVNEPFDPARIWAALEIVLKFLHPGQPDDNIRVLAKTVAEIAINPPERIAETDKIRIVRNEVEGELRRFSLEIHRQIDLN